MRLLRDLRLLSPLTAAVLILITVAWVRPGEPGSAQTTPTPEPTSHMPAPRRELTLDDVAATEEQTERDSRIRHVSGHETMGSIVNIAGTDIQLPENAWVESRIVSIFCVEGQVCPRMPYWIIARGDRTIEIDGDGNLWPLGSENHDPEFLFIEEALGW